MTSACLRFLTAALLSAAVVGCGPPPKPAPAPVEPTTAPITVPAFTPEAMPSTTDPTSVVPGPPPAETAPTTGAATPAPEAPAGDVPKTAMKLPPATEPAPEAPVTAAPVLGAAKPIVDPRLLVNGMALGMVMRPRQTYEAPAFSTPEMQALLKPPAKSFDANGIHDARKIDLIVALGTFQAGAVEPDFAAVVKVVDKAAGDELEAGPLKSKMSPKALGDKTIYVDYSLMPGPVGANVETATATETIGADQSEERFEKATSPAAPAPEAAPAPKDGCQDAPETETVELPNVEPADAAGPSPNERSPQASWRVDDVTFVVAPLPRLEAIIKAYDANEAASDELVSLLSSADPKSDVTIVFLTAPVKDQLSTLAAQLPPLPAEFKDVAALPELVNTLTLNVSISPEPKITLAARSPDEASSKRVATLLENGVSEVKPMWGLGKQAIAGQVPSEQFKPAMSWAIGLVDKTMKGLKVEQAGEEATLHVGGLGTLEAIVAEGAPHVRLMTGEMRRAADRTIAMNNLKQLALAFHNHESIFQTFPSAEVCDPAGKPLLSWRVAILPLIDQGELAKQFHLDEPWDSEHNKKLIEKMPDVFKSPGVVVEAGKTLFLVPTGPHALFDGAKKPKISEVVDGLSNTILIVEANPDQAVTWTKPDDLPIDLNALPNLGKARVGGALAAMMDGAVYPLAAKIPADTLKALFTPKGGEVIDGGVSGEITAPPVVEDSAPEKRDAAAPEAPAAPAPAAPEAAKPE
ncbi:MAG TPA: DUF1559 domain-containing protein [Pirellulales bacterium]